jgi:hypothetical protein
VTRHRLTRRTSLIVGSAGVVALVFAGVLVATAHSNDGPTATSAPRHVVGGGARRPGLGEVERWQWVLGASFDIDDREHVGVGWTNGEGSSAPPPTLYDVDGFTTDTATVAALHDRGAIVVCYVETGAWERYRPDAADYPADVLGLSLAGYPDERYVDIRADAVFERVRARVQMCADKGFDAVEPDIDDSYTEQTGFAITRRDNVAFNARVAELVHSLGLLIALKNGDEPEFALAMEPLVDFAIVEQCFEFDSCESFEPFVRAGKPVLVAEYDLDPAEFCAAADRQGFVAASMTEALTGETTPCR